MNSSKALAKRILAIILALALQMVFLQTGTRAQDGQSGKLVTTGNQSVLVNGNQMSGGGTILSGATIETPPGVGATINLGPLGSVDLAPGTQAVLDFSDGRVRVKVIRGCAVVKTKQGKEGEVSTEQGVVETTEKNKKRRLDVCAPGFTPSDIGSGAGGTGGLSKALLAVLLAGGAGALTIALIIANRDDNPSPS